MRGGAAREFEVDDDVDLGDGVVGPEGGAHNLVGAAAGPGLGVKAGVDEIDEVGGDAGGGVDVDAAHEVVVAVGLGAAHDAGVALADVHDVGGTQLGEAVQVAGPRRQRLFLAPVVGGNRRPAVDDLRHAHQGLAARGRGHSVDRGFSLHTGRLAARRCSYRAAQQRGD